MSERDEVVITGMSINTPLGDTLDGFIDAMYEGRSALSNWHSIDASRIYSKVGADLGAYDLEAKLQSLEERIPGDVWRRLRKLHVNGYWSLIGKIARRVVVASLTSRGTTSGVSSFDRRSRGCAPQAIC